MSDKPNPVVDKPADKPVTGPVVGHVDVPKPKPVVTSPTPLAPVKVNLVEQMDEQRKVIAATEARLQSQRETLDRLIGKHNFSLKNA